MSADTPESLDNLGLYDFMRRVDGNLHEILQDVKVSAFRLELDASDIPVEERYRECLMYLGENLGAAMNAIRHLREITQRLALEVIELQGR